MLPRPDSPGLGLGLPLIATLTESLELGTGAGEQTEVRMTFRLAATARIARRRERADARATRRPWRSARARSSAPSSGAWSGMLAARAQCPIDRLDDAMLLTDAVAAHAPAHTADAHVQVVGRRRATAPSSCASARSAPTAPTRLLADADLPGVGNVFKRVADEVDARSARRRPRRARPAPALPAHERGSAHGRTPRDADPGLRRADHRGARPRPPRALLQRACFGLRVLAREDDRIWLAAGEHARLGLWLPGEKEFGDEGGRHVHFAFSAGARRPRPPGRAAGRGGPRLPRTGRARRRRPVAVRRGPRGQRRRGLGLLRARRGPPRGRRRARRRRRDVTAIRQARGRCHRNSH